jgi:hypothetical protein
MLIGNNKIRTNQGIKQGYPVLPSSCNISIDEAIRQWQDVLTEEFEIGNTVLSLIFIIFGRSDNFSNQRTTFKEQSTDLKT